MNELPDAGAPLSRLRTLADYQSERSHVFPSESSLQWFVRRHKAALVDSGALLMLAGRKVVEPQAFDRVVMKVGMQSARRAA
jgi:hypothetical protein